MSKYTNVKFKVFWNAESKHWVPPYHGIYSVGEDWHWYRFTRLDNKDDKDWIEQQREIEKRIDADDTLRIALLSGLLTEAVV